MSSKTQYAVLGALSIKPMTGYDMKKMMDGSTNHFWRESNGQLYPTLAKLAKEKLVTFKNEKVGEKMRKVYSISKTGKKKLQQWLLEDVEYYPGRNELLLKLFYGKNVAPEISIAHIEKHAEKCQVLLDIYKGIERKLLEMVKKKERPVYYLLTVKAGIKSVKTELEWCKESVELIHEYA